MLILLSFVLPVVIPLLNGSGSTQNDSNNTAAPDFTLPSVNGSDVTLSAIAAKHSATVLVFLETASCPACIQQLAEYQASYAALVDEGGEVVAIAIDPQAAVQTLAEQTSAAFPVLYDPNGSTAGAYGFRDYLIGDFAMVTVIVGNDMEPVGNPVGTQPGQIIPASSVLDVIRQIKAGITTSG